MIKNYIAYSLLLGLTLTVYGMYDEPQVVRDVQTVSRELYKGINVPGFFRSMIGDVGIPTFERIGRFTIQLIADAYTDPEATNALQEMAYKMTAKQATLVGLSLIPAFYLLYQASYIPGIIARKTYSASKGAYEYLTDYLGKTQREEILNKTKEQVETFIKDLQYELNEIQQDKNLSAYDRNKIITTKQQAETIRERINQLGLMASERQILLDQIQNIINNLEIEQDRASYTLDPRYIGRQIKKAPGQIYQKIKGYLPSYLGGTTTAVQ